MELDTSAGQKENKFEVFQCLNGSIEGFFHNGECRKINFKHKEQKVGGFSMIFNGIGELHYCIFSKLGFVC